MFSILKHKTNWVLASIVIVGAVLRLLWLDKYPAGFTPDEAAFGYNAYSILKTGKDEWGTPWWKLPYTNLRSFGDYKLPLYSFLAIPGIKIFGLNEFTTRLPNALLGTMAILAVYLCATKLLKQSSIGLAAAALLAISPWAISLSRGAFEANLATFFLPLGLYLYLANKSFFSALVFSLGAYSYHSTRAITPLILALTFIFYKRINWKFVLLFTIFSLPIIFSVLGTASSRISDVGLFNPTDNWNGVATRRFEARNRGLSDAISRLFSNKLIYTVSTTFKNYVSYFSPQFLFTSGAGEATYGMIPGRGVLYYVEIPLLISFLILLIKRPASPTWFLLSLILVSALPAALSKGPGYPANRVAALIPFLYIAISMGLVNLLGSLKDYKKALTIFLLCAYSLSLIFFLEDYVYHAPSINPQSMTYGWRELAPRLKSIAQRFTDVRISRSLSEPHIFVAFYWQIDPNIYQKAAGSWSDFSSKGYKFLDQYDGYYLNNYRFGNIYPKDAVDHPVLYVGKSDDFPPDYGEYFHIDYPNGQPAIQVAEKLP